MLLEAEAVWSRLMPVVLETLDEVCFRGVCVNVVPSKPCGESVNRHAQLAPPAEIPCPRVRRGLSRLDSRRTAQSVTHA